MSETALRAEIATVAYSLLKMADIALQHAAVFSLGFAHSIPPKLATAVRK